MDRKPTNAPPYAELPLPELLRQLSSDTAILVQQEIALARAELTERTKTVARAATGFGIAAVLGLGAFLALTTMIIALLALVVPLWAAALIVTIVYGVIAGMGALSGKKALASGGAPIPQTIETLKEDAKAVRAGIDRGR